jgi:hypothetical protein
MFPEAMLKALGDRVELSARAVTLRAKGEHLIVDYERGGQPHSLSARHVMSQRRHPTRTRSSPTLRPPPQLRSSS